MKDLEKLRRWLLTFPGWPGELSVDKMQAGSATGLFPLGLEETDRKEDFLGNAQAVCRYRFALYTRLNPGQDCAQWLLDFQNWVQQQSIAGLAPRFGDIPHAERLQAREGVCKDPGVLGTYAVTLIADFVREYPLEEGGSV